MNLFRTIIMRVDGFYPYMGKWCIRVGEDSGRGIGNCPPIPRIRTIHSHANSFKRIPILLSLSYSHQNFSIISCPSSSHLPQNPQ